MLCAHSSRSTAGEFEEEWLSRAATTRLADNFSTTAISPGHEEVLGRGKRSRAGKNDDRLFVVAALLWLDLFRGNLSLSIAPFAVASQSAAQRFPYQQRLP